MWSFCRQLQNIPDMFLECRHSNPPVPCITGHKNSHVMVSRRIQYVTLPLHRHNGRYSLLQGLPKFIQNIKVWPSKGYFTVWFLPEGDIFCLIPDDILYNRPIGLGFRNRPHPNLQPLNIYIITILLYIFLIIVIFSKMFNSSPIV